MWLRESKPVWWLLPGMVSLALFAWLLTLVRWWPCERGRHHDDTVAGDDPVGKVATVVTRTIARHLASLGAPIPLTGAVGGWWGRACGTEVSVAFESKPTDLDLQIVSDGCHRPFSPR